MGNCFSSGKEGHKVRDCLNIKVQYKNGGQAQTSGSNVDSPRKIHYYEPVLEWKGGSSIPIGRIISCLKACKMIS